MVKTSIIVPVYNTSKYLKDCFTSIFEQTQQEIEVIAINDGSTDDSLNILEEIKSEHPEMMIFSQENKGLGAARNKGMELATGEFIYFIDSDDCLVSNAMELCYYYAKTHKADIIMFDADVFGDIEPGKNQYDRSKIIKEQECVMSGEEYAQKYWLKTFSSSACLIYTSSSFLKKNNLKFIPETYYEDVDFHIKAFPLAKSIMYIPRKLYRRRYRESSIMMSRFDERHAKDFLQIIREIDGQVHSAYNEKIIQEMQYRHLNSLLKRCKENDLLKNEEFSREFYETAQKIYGYDVNKIGQYRNINVLYQLSDVLDEGTVPADMRKRIHNRKKEIWEKICSEIPLASGNKCIGIYGIGRNAEDFLDAYEENEGEIKADVIFIESNVKSGEKKYRDREVFNLSEIGEMILDCIVIASSRYEQEMYQAIREKYDNKFRVVYLSLNFW